MFSLLRPHLLFLSFASFLVIALGAIQSIVLIQLSPDFEMTQTDFLLQTWANSIDFVFPLLILILTLTLLPTLMDSGILHHYVTLPWSRTKILAANFTALLCCFADLLLCYMLTCWAIYGVYTQTWALPSFLPWLATIALTALTLCIPSLLLLLCYLLHQNRMVALLLTFFAIFLLDILAGFTDLFVWIPSTNLYYFAESMFDVQKGYGIDAFTFGLTCTIVLIWLAVLYFSTRKLFLNTLLN